MARSAGMEVGPLAGVFFEAVEVVDGESHVLSLLELDRLTVQFPDAQHLDT